MAVVLKWFSEIPESTVNTANPDIPNKIAVDKQRRVHLAWVSTRAYGQGNPTLIYGCGTPDGDFVIFGNPTIAVQKYQWINFHAVLGPKQFFEGMPFDLAVDSKGLAHICYQGFLTVDGEPFPQVTHSVWDPVNGIVETDVFDGNVVASGVAIAIAGNDSVHIAYTDQNGDLRYATRAAGGAAFQLTPVDLVPEDFCSNPSIAVGADGTIGISYLNQLGRDDESVGELRLSYAEKPPATGWSLDTADIGPLNAGASGLVNLGTSLTNSLLLDSESSPHIAYFVLGQGLRHVSKSPAHVWSGELIDSVGQPTPAQILLDANDVVSVIYQAMSAQQTTELRYAYRSHPGVWATSTVDPSPNCGMFVSAATGATGLPHVGYNVFNQMGDKLVSHALAVDASIKVRPFPHPTGPHKPILKIP